MESSRQFWWPKLYGSLGGRFNPKEEFRASRLEPIRSWKEGFLESSLALQENNTDQTSASKNIRVPSFALPLRFQVLFHPIYTSFQSIFISTGGDPDWLPCPLIPALGAITYIP